MKKERRAWQPLQPATTRPASFWRDAGMTAPNEVYVNDLYSVYVRYLEETRDGALHISFHRHNRAAVRDWRHFQAIKNEAAGPERLAVEVFPPESNLLDQANEYHLWVLNAEHASAFPYLFAGEKQLMDMTEVRTQLGSGTKARQRDWQPGIPTGKGLQ